MRKRPAGTGRWPEATGAGRNRPGVCGIPRSRRWGCSPTMWPGWMWSSSAAVPRTYPRGSLAPGLGRSGSIFRASSWPPRARCSGSPASPSHSCSPMPSGSLSRAPLSTWPSASTAPVCGAIRTGGSRKPRGCCGRAGVWRSSVVRRCSRCALPSAGGPLLRPQFGLRQHGDGTSVEFHLPHGEMLRLLRSCGFVVEDLIEIQAPESAHRDYPEITAAWAHQWPSEEIWKARLSC